MVVHFQTSSTSIGFRPTFSTSKPSRKQAKNAIKTHREFTGKETNCETGYFGARYDDPTLLTSWTAVDPMADKYPSLSPYNYCAWNPMKLVDPDGETPRIYVEQTGVGHAFMTVGEGKNTIVYTYGRYLGGKHPKLGSVCPTGKGVLIKLTGQDAQDYIKHQLKDNNAKVYEMKNGIDENVMTYYDEILSKSRTLTKDEASIYYGRPNYGSSKDCRVVDTYDLFSNNCVTTTINGAKAGDKNLDISYPIAMPSAPFTNNCSEVYNAKPFKPSTLERVLSAMARNINSGVKDVTQQMQNEFLQ